jgi:hypothetical protein
MASPNTIILNLQKYKTVFDRIEKWIYKLNPTIAKKTEQEFKVYIESLK